MKASPELTGLWGGSATLATARNDRQWMPGGDDVLERDGVSVEAAAEGGEVALIGKQPGGGEDALERERRREAVVRRRAPRLLHHPGQHRGRRALARHVGDQQRE